MTDTKAASGLTVKQWNDRFFVEHLQENRFSSDMGRTENAIIQVNQDLSRKKGEYITFALVNLLTGDGVENGGTIEGNEEQLDTRSFEMAIKDRGHGVRSNRWDNQISAIDLRKAAKGALKTWSLENTKQRIITALGSIDGVSYASASEANKDTWLANNADRVIFGSALANNASNDHSASLLNIDSANDILTSGVASLMKRMARNANPKIRPVRSSVSGRMFYVVYVPTLVFRDLKTDPVIVKAMQETTTKMRNEPLFQGGDIEWDGLIFKEIEDISVIAGVGAAGLDVAPVYLCGAQALGYGIAERWKSAEELFDYGRKKGCAIMEMGGIEKLRFGTGAVVDVDDSVDPKDHGMVTGYFAAEADG